VASAVDSQVSRTILELLVQIANSSELHSRLEGHCMEEWLAGKVLEDH
jgi:hypothetical protein